MSRSVMSATLPPSASQSKWAMTKVPPETMTRRASRAARGRSNQCQL
jgi:hypothetical protein